jgi:hypothetical protein
MRSPYLSIVSATLIAVGASTPAPADSTWISESGQFELSAHSELNPIIINKMHRWSLQLVDAQGEPVSGAEISVQGGMPAHDHGLPTAPRIAAGAEPGVYLLDGLRFHMRGQWELDFTIRAGTMHDVVIVRIEL